MRLGTEDKTKVKWAIGLLSVAIAVAIGNFGFGQRFSTPVHAASVRTPLDS
ncbi:MAG TPA: hypothetical protein VNV88_11175 [Candidatus Solibacter sp.]|jgi:hypothetical protein|nr:hypothetical protein [Candidatus Solibacter sp.]